jgi:hypothetical protein
MWVPARLSGLEVQGSSAYAEGLVVCGVCLGYTGALCRATQLSSFVQLRSGTWLHVRPRKCFVESYGCYIVEQHCIHCMFMHCDRQTCMLGDVRWCTPWCGGLAPAAYTLPPSSLIQGVDIQSVMGSIYFCSIRTGGVFSSTVGLLVMVHKHACRADGAACFERVTDVSCWISAAA